MFGWAFAWSPVAGTSFCTTRFLFWPFCWPNNQSNHSFIWACWVAMVWATSCIRWWLRLFDVSIAWMSYWISNEVVRFGLKTNPSATSVTSSANTWLGSTVEGEANVILAWLSVRNILWLSVHGKWTNYACLWFWMQSRLFKFLIFFRIPP